MDEGTSGRIQERVLALGCLFIATAVLAWGCHKGPYRVFKAKGGEFTCEIPSDWRWYVDKDWDLSGQSPDNVELLGAGFLLSREEKGETIETLTEHMEWMARHWADDKTYSHEPLAMVKVGEFQGISYTTTQMDVNDFESSFGPMSKEELKRLRPKPKPVLCKETFVHFDTPGGHYYLKYNGPVVLYDKYLPVFKHLLKTFRWTKKA
ncbi:MAG: hypothetical protein HY922_15725 [Elusimicrobia bacterium]|nr:hypothetical protein [Elusimicrobiota bacterium]